MFPYRHDFSVLKPWQSYIFAIVATAATLWVHLAMSDLLENQSVIIIFTVPIMLSAYLGGLYPGLLATAISFFTASYYLLTPLHSFHVDSGVERWRQFFIIMAGVFISVTNAALHSARRRSKNSEARATSLLAGAADAIIHIDSHGIIESLNVAAEKLFRYSASEIVGQNVKILMPQPYKSEHDTYLHNYITTGVKKIIGIGRGVKGLRKNGETFPMDLAVSEIKTGEQRLFTGIVRDITDRKKFEHTLQEKNKFEHASRMKSEFLATMSHELRTPLNAIIGFSEALKDGLMGPLTNTQQEYVGDIFASGQHLLSLINDILDLSKVEAGMMALELKMVDVQKLMANSFSIIRERAAAHNISLILTMDETVNTIQLDTRKTKQIIYNLLSNAFKFSPDNGQVSLSVRRVLRKNVGNLEGPWPVQNFDLEDSDYEEFIEICVTDNGMGISVEDMTKLFQAFSQIDNSLARQFEGTGLGLSMVKQLAELHGGSVAVASKEGEGSIFATWLPLRSVSQDDDALTTVKKTASTANSPFKERFALIVEDDHHMTDLIRLLLEAEGFIVLCAPTAEIAFVLAQQQPLSLITLDIQLPGADGWDYLLRIREIPALSQIPVVIIAGVIDRNMALARGATAVLQKPVSRAQLKASLAIIGLTPSEQHPCTILVVDDDPKAVEVITAFLPMPAYAIVRAYVGNEAIIIAQQILPDLILLDLMMPEVSGFDVVEALQLNADTARIPILVITAKQLTPRDSAVLNNSEGKFIHVIEKSAFNSAHFIIEVKHALERRSYG